MYNVNESSQAVHAMGNGYICGYAKRLNIFQLFGPDYSAPDACSIDFMEGCDTAETSRIPKTAVWHHNLFKGNKKIAAVRDFATANRKIFARYVEGEENTVWRIDCLNSEKWFQLPGTWFGGVQAYFATIPAGTQFYNSCSGKFCTMKYVYPLPVFICLLLDGDIESEQLSNTSIKVTVKAGTIAVAFGNDFASLIGECHGFLKLGVNNIYQETVQDGLQFTKRRLQNRELPDSIDDIADNVAMLIRSQQSASGGIMAGHRFHLAYIRDNYGTLLGLLKLGCFDEARKLLEFYIRTYERYGELHTAQGTDCFAFHIHECDSVEITGYLILMVAEYFKATGDTELLFKSRPLIWWAVIEQHKMLKNGMLPFNGDETYIAGHLYPRTAINDGSVEATALYHKASLSLIELADLLGLSGEQKSLLKSDIMQIENNFENNFVAEGKLYVNCPGFYRPGEAPLIRNGVYLCGHGMGSCASLNKDGVYVCPECVDKSIGLKANADTRYYIPSAILMSVIVGSPFMKKPYARRCVDEMLESFYKNGSLFSGYNDKIVGYEYGGLLFALKSLQNAVPGHIEAVTREMLSALDETGAWVEYYENGQPSGCMCRPWESGINIAALIETTMN